MGLCNMSQLILCPQCKRQFVTRHDFERHLETHWRLTWKKNGHTIPKDCLPVLASRLANTGSITENQYRYALLGDVIYRTRVVTKY